MALLPPAELLEAGATAILVANNLMTVGVLHAIKEAGMRVGEDVSLVSIDDPPWAELTDPPLTTLGQPVRAMADAAVELLFARLEGGRKRRKVRVFEFELHHRGSCRTGWREMARRRRFSLNPRDSGQVGTDHLVEWGHKRTGFIGGPQGIETAAERLFGYRQALFAARFRPLPAVGDYRLEGPGRELRVSSRRANALVVASNLLAAGALREARGEAQVAQTPRIRVRATPSQLLLFAGARPAPKVRR